MKALWALLPALLLCGCAVDSDFESADGTASDVKISLKVDCGGAWDIRASRNEIDPTALIMGDGADDMPSKINVYAFRASEAEGVYLYTGKEYELDSGGAFEITGDVDEGYYKFLAVGCADNALPRNLINVTGRQFEETPKLTPGVTTFVEASLHLSDESIGNTPVTANPLFTGKITEVNGTEADHVAISGSSKSYSCSLTLTRAVAGLYVYLYGIPQGYQHTMYNFNGDDLYLKPDYMCITATYIGKSISLANLNSPDYLLPSINTGSNAIWPYDVGVIVAERYIAPNNWDENSLAGDEEETVKNGMRMAAFMLPAQFLNDKEYSLCLWLGIRTYEMYSEYESLWNFASDNAYLCLPEEEIQRDIAYQAFSEPYVLKIQKRSDGANVDDATKYSIEANHFYMLADPTDPTKPLRMENFARSGSSDSHNPITLILREM